MTETRKPSGFSEGNILHEGKAMGPMPWVLAILMFVTVLAAAAGLAMGAASMSLSSDLAHRLTVQVIEANPDIRHAQTQAIANLLARNPSVASAKIADDAELNRLVSPWLGNDADAADLPYPALIDVSMRDSAQVDLSALTAAVTAIAPSAHVVPDITWLSPFARLLNLMIALAAAIVALMMTAVAAAVMLSARAALDTHRVTIDILHLMGASDSQIAKLFQRRMAIEALVSGVVGLVGAVIVLLGVEGLTASVSSEFLSSTMLQWWAWIILALLPPFAAVLANFSARNTVMRALRKLT